MELLNVLVTGATGYVGGRLVPCLLNAGHAVRCMGRDPDRLTDRPWSDAVDIVQGDALDRASLDGVLDGIDVAYYLIHSLGAGEDTFADRDRTAAANFADAAKGAGVQRIIYLGGIEPEGEASPHLQSRVETGEVLRASGIPVTEFRAAVIVGSGSLSFEMVRYLTERVPVMITPSWVRTPTQPIAIRNVLQYLTATLRTPESAGKILQIGGADVLSYADMFRTYARVRGLRRVVVRVPFLSPHLSSRWVGLVTPIPNSVAGALIEGLRNETTVSDHTARTLFPDIEPMTYEAAVRLALERFRDDNIETSWRDAFSSSVRDDAFQHDLQDEEGLLVDRHQILADATAEDAFRVVKTLGGETGWLYADPLWELRGWMDKAVGGVGTRRGRRSVGDVRVGEAVDFWRVEELVPNRLLRLRAEMKVPGKAWLQFETIPTDDGRVQIVQTAFFEPHGLSGLAYWYSIYPLHGLIFRGMLRELARRAREGVPTRNPDAILEENEVRL